MQPNDPRPTKRAAARALRTHLRHHLGWLEGHPLEVMEGGDGSSPSIRWRVWTGSEGAPTEVEVGRETLRRAKTGLRGAMRKFPRALPRLVGDVDQWSAGIERRLELIAGVLHREEPLPSAEAASESGADVGSWPRWCAAELAWIVQGIEGQPRLAASDLQARLRAWRGALETVRAELGDEAARTGAIGVVTSALGDGGAGGRLREFLADPRVYSVALEPGDSGPLLVRIRRYLKKGAKGDPPVGPTAAPTPTPALGRELAALLGERLPRRVLRALDPLLDRRALEAWGEWWREYGATEREARSAIGKWVSSTATDPALVDRLDDLRERIEEIGEPPSPWTLEESRRLAMRLVDAAPDGVGDAVVEAVAATPDEEIPSHGKSGSSHAPSLVCGDWVDALEDELSGPRAKELARMQRRIALASGRSAQYRARVARAFSSMVVIRCTPRPRITWGLRGLAVRTLEEIAERGERGRRFLRDADQWSAAEALSGTLRAVEAVGAESTPPELIATLVLRARAAGSFYDEDLVARVALVGDPSRVEEIYAAAGDLDPDPDDFAALREVAVDPAAAEILAALFVDREFKQLKRLALLAGGVRRLGLDCAPPADPDVDAAGHPALAWVGPEVRQAARQLEALAGPIALDRALGSTFVRPARLEEELRTLSGIERPTWQQEARLEVLRERLRTPPVPKARHVASCLVRIERRLRRERVLAWERALAERLAHNLPEALRPRVADPAQLPLIGALAALRPSIRAIAWRLLEGETFADDPAHAAWRRRMEARGLRLDPWLEPSVERRAVSPAGRELTVRIERDPVEIFQMGRWFDTCLSPGEMNFFSVVANAADQNKRLAVVRDAQGVAQGRCLLALTSKGTMVAFYVYAHEERDWIVRQVRALAEELSEAVGAPLVGEGEIEVLVATAWYDDGTWDLTGRLAELEPGGQLAEALRAASPSRAHGLILDAIGEEMFEAAFERVVEARVLIESAERMRSLEPALRRRRLAPYAALDVARTLRGTDDELACEVLRLAVGRRRRRPLAVWHETSTGIAQILAEVGDPSLALRVLRLERATGDRADLARASAHAALGRVDRSRRILEALAAKGVEAARKRLVQEP